MSIANRSGVPFKILCDACIVECALYIVQENNNVSGETGQFVPQSPILFHKKESLGFLIQYCKFLFLRIVFSVVPI